MTETIPYLDKKPEPKAYPVIAPVTPPAEEKITKAERDELKQYVKRHKKQQKHQAKLFEKSIKRNRPSFDIAALAREYNLDSKKSSNYLVQLAMQASAMANATAYANEELAVTLDSDGNDINADEINRFSRGMIRIKLLEHMAQFYKLPADIMESIINLQISKDFALLPNTPRVAPASRPNLNRSIDDGNQTRAKAIKKVIPFGRKEGQGPQIVKKRKA